MTAKCSLSPHAACFFAAPSERNHYISKLSPDAAIFVSTPVTYSPITKLSPHAASFFATPSGSSTDLSLRTLAIDAFKSLQIFDALKESIAAVELGQAAVNVAFDIMMQQEVDCEHHYNALLKWRDYQRYGEEIPDDDFERTPPLADARRSRCSKCSEYLPGMQQRYEDTLAEYVRLVAEHDAAIDAYDEHVERCNASLVNYYASLVPELTFAA